LHAALDEHIGHNLLGCFLAHIHPQDSIELALQFFCGMLGQLGLAQAARGVQSHDGAGPVAFFQEIAHILLDLAAVNIGNGLGWRDVSDGIARFRRRGHLDNFIPHDFDTIYLIAFHMIPSRVKTRVVQ